MSSVWRNRIRANLFKYTAQAVALSSRAMTSPAYLQSASLVCGLSAPQSASYVHQKTRVASQQTLAASQLFPDSPLDAIPFMPLMRRQQKLHTHGKSTHSLGHLNRHQTQQELNGVCAAIRATIFILMGRLASNHAVSYPMLQLVIIIVNVLVEVNAKCKVNIFRSLVRNFFLLLKAEWILRLYNSNRHYAHYSLYSRA